VGDPAVLLLGEEGQDMTAKLERPVKTPDIIFQQIPSQPEKEEG
jgi:hypothetical protein